MTTGDGPTCHAEGCPVEVPPAMFICQPHWYMVPPPLREAIQVSYRRGQEIDKAPSNECLAIAHAAIAEVANKESQRGRRKPRPPAKPVQLALFDV